ncbi:MAG: hypothetical protein R6V60_02790 [Desulfobacterales bacterium]|jgi:hypothetical protein
MATLLVILYLAIAITLLLLLICVAAVPAAPQNPFTGRKEPVSPAPRFFSSNTVLAKIALWQLQVREKMAALVRRANQEKSLRPLASLILLAFAYGGLHAAGPGHGKAIAVSLNAPAGSAATVPENRRLSAKNRVAIHEECGRSFLSQRFTGR